MLYQGSICDSMSATDRDADEDRPRFEGSWSDDEVFFGSSMDV